MIWAPHHGATLKNGLHSTNPASACSLPQPNTFTIPVPYMIWADCKICSAAEKGPYYGPFNDGAEVAAFLRKEHPKARH